MLTDTPARSKQPIQKFSPKELNELRTGLTHDRTRLERLGGIRKEYLTNVMLIFNAFFEYGLINSQKHLELLK